MKAIICDLGHFNAHAEVDPFYSWHNHGAGLVVASCRAVGQSIDFTGLKYLTGWEAFKNKVRGYDLVGFSCLSTDLPRLNEAVRIVKEMNPNVITIVGGMQVTVGTQRLLDNPNIDYIFHGEAEITFPEFLKDPKKYDREIYGKATENLNTLPWIDRMIYPMPLERNVPMWGQSPVLSILTARGCPFNCAFCLDGDTLITMKDLTYKKIKDIKVGEKIMGFEKVKRGQKFKVATVQNTFKRISSTIILKTDRGEVITTEEHPWLSYANHSRFRLTKNLKVGDKIKWVTTPTEFRETKEYKWGYLAGSCAGDGSIGHYKRTDKKWKRSTLTNHFKIVGDDEMIDTFLKYATELKLNVHQCKFNGGKYFKYITRAIGGFSKETTDIMEEITSRKNCTIDFKLGFLSGFYDADGSCTKNRENHGALRFSNLNVDLLNKTDKYLHEFGFNTVWEKKGIRIVGDMGEKIRFWSMTQPKVIHKRQIMGVGNGCATILFIEQGGEQEVYNIATTTETYIANGLASHNCQPAEKKHFGAIVRRRSVDNVIAEINQWLRFKPKFIIFHDDHFCFKKEWLEEFVEKYRPIGLPFWAATRADFVCQNPEIFTKLRNVGMEVCSIGFESGNQKTLDMVRKGTTVEQNYQSAKIIGDTGMQIYANIMYGFPGETEQAQKDTRKLCLYISSVSKALISPAFFTPYPGNDLGDDCIAKGLSLVDDQHLNRYGIDKIKGVDYQFLSALINGKYDHDLV